MFKMPIDASSHPKQSKDDFEEKLMSVTETPLGQTSNWDMMLPSDDLARLT